MSAPKSTTTATKHLASAVENDVASAAGGIVGTLSEVNPLVLMAGSVVVGGVATVLYLKRSSKFALVKVTEFNSTDLGNGSTEASPRLR